MPQFVIMLALEMTIIISFAYSSNSQTAGPRIVGGIESGIRELHPLVALRKWFIRSKQHRQLCGGTLLNEYCILTAAHCFSSRKSPYRYDFIVGAHNLTGYAEDPLAKKYLVKKIIIHPSYMWNVEKGYDIAIACTDSPVQYNEYIEPVKLPQKVDATKDCTSGTVYGWGVTKEDSNLTTDILRKVDVPVVINAQCRMQYENVSVIYDHQICFGYDVDGKDSCQGDSGGPLMCNTGAYKGFQIGIVSYGLGCGRAAFPGIFTRTFHFLKWINSTVTDFLDDYINY